MWNTSHIQLNEQHQSNWDTDTDKASPSKRRRNIYLWCLDVSYKHLSIIECRRSHRAEGNLPFSFDLPNLWLRRVSFDSSATSELVRPEPNSSPVTCQHHMAPTSPRSPPDADQVEHCCQVGGVTAPVRAVKLAVWPPAGGGGERERGAREKPHSSWRVRALHNCRHAANRRCLATVEVCERPPRTKMSELGLDGNWPAGGSSNQRVAAVGKTSFDGRAAGNFVSRCKVCACVI